MASSEISVPARLNRAAAAEYLGVKMSTLEAWATHGKGPRFCKIGGKVVYFVREIDSWIESRSTNCTASLPKD